MVGVVGVVDAANPTGAALSIPSANPAQRAQPATQAAAGPQGAGVQTWQILRAMRDTEWVAVG